jgi:SIR2-like domain
MQSETPKAGENGARDERAGGAIDAMVSLATSVHGSPGVYALLLGAGLSIGAGIPTGWGIVQDLVGQIAAAKNPDDPGAFDAAKKNPVAWWEEHGHGELGYSELLGDVARSAAARQNLLSRYFQGPEIAPSPAHRAVAELVRRGSVRVIITTNFDRLTEQALAEAGIAPQIIHSPAECKSATPLVHSKATIIKLHGDYLDHRSLNTAEELASYPKAQLKLLNQVLDEFGLIVCGWSAEWDSALVKAVQGNRSRRFPLYWSAYSTVGDKAQGLIAQHGAAVIEGKTADQFLPDLVHRLDALDLMRESPVSRDVAVTRLKKALTAGDRIEVSELVDQTTSRVLDLAKDPEHHPVTIAEATNITLARAGAASIIDYRAEADTLLHLLATGAFHDDGTFENVWLRPTTRLVKTRAKAPNFCHPVLEKLHHYPALLATWTVGVAAVLAHREKLIAPLLSTPNFKDPLQHQLPVMPAAATLNPAIVLDAEQLHLAPNELGALGTYPQSRLVRRDAREPLRGVEPDDDAYVEACNRFEFLASMISNDSWAQVGVHELSRYPWVGEYVLDHSWNGDDSLAERIKQEISPNWPLLRAGAFGGDEGRAHAALDAVVGWGRSF